MTDQFLRLRDFAASIAIAAGELQKDSFLQSQVVAQFKSEYDVVLDVDKRSEALLLDRIQSHFPSHSIYSEEVGYLEGDDEMTWLVDPLDGTNNFACGIPYFAVSLALQHRNQALLGVVYEPMTGRLYSAVRGHGAYLNERRLSVSKANSKRPVVSLIRGHVKSGAEQLEESFSVIERGLKREARRVLSTWAPSIDWCLLAAGKIDGVVSFESEREDMWAGRLIAEEAGLPVTDFNGSGASPHATRIFACRNEFQALLHGIVAKL